MADPEIEGWKVEVARLRQENDAQRKTIDELLTALSAARSLCKQLGDALSALPRT